jgi:hypothetical protein
LKAPQRKSLLPSAGFMDKRSSALLPWVLLFLWTILLFSGLSFAPRLWEAIRSFLPGGAALLPWITLLASLLFLTGAMLRSASAPRGRLLLLIAGWALCFGSCTALLSRYPVEPLHAAEYVVLALLTRWSFKTVFSGNRAWAWSFFFAAGVGTVEEVLQYWTPGRVYDPRDLALNGCAVFFGLLLAACMEYARSGKDDLNMKGGRR